MSCVYCVCVCVKIFDDATALGTGSCLGWPAASSTPSTPHRPSEGAASTQILPFGLVRLERALVSQSVDSQLRGMDTHCAEEE